MRPVVIPANQFADVFAAGAIAALLDLLVDECPQSLGQGDIHGTHAGKLGTLAKFGNSVAGPMMPNFQSRRFS